MEIIMDEQAALWNGSAGCAWVEEQGLLDQLYKPLEDLLIERISSGSVLDIGCGTGGTTLATAKLLGEKGDCTGIDISDPMLNAARARAKQANTSINFVHADAQNHAFKPESFDWIISRFGVMFFDDSVRAFVNLRNAARQDAKLRFIAWRSATENPFMTTAERSAAPLLPNLSPRNPGAPGQFAFADENKVYSILQESGWSEIEIRPFDVTCTFPEKELVRYFTRFGPVGLALQEVDNRTRALVIETIRAAFDPYVHGTEVRFIAACWMVEARAR